MAGKRPESGRGALNDRKICLAVTIGVLVGFFVSLVQFYTSGTPHASVVKSEVKNADGGVKVSSDSDSLFWKHKYEALEKQHSEAVSERDALRVKVQSLSKDTPRITADKSLIVGPPGTVKSIRTNPSIIPNRNVNPQLADILEKIAINNELIVGISNFYIHDMLKTWFESIQRTGIKNYIVVALDDEVADFCKQHNVPVYRRDATISDAQKNAGMNHAISGLKFHLLREFLQLGYSVLLSDIDILYFKNPFDHLYRDSDVESMTDGFDNATAYGYDDVTDDPSMGWARYAHTMRIFVFNSGLFYIRSTIPSIELLDRVTARLAKENSWDQAVFNEELFYPSHPGYIGLHASTRVLDFYDFLNSKVLFKFIRKDLAFKYHVPVTIHVNYHPEKHERMLALVEYYVNGKKDALDRFPDGSFN